MPERVLALRGIEKSFGATRALSGVDLIAHSGEIHAVLGENGAGKSTLMKILSGALEPDGGVLEIAGLLRRPRDPLEARRLGVAIVYQEPSLCPDLTVEENVLLGAEPVRFGIIDRREVERRVGRALALLGETAARSISPGTLVRELSASERQLVEIARALAQIDCKILILDEPTSSLGAADVERLFELLRALKQRGMATLYISHFLEEVTQIADRYTVLRDGRSVATGAVSESSLPELVKSMAGRPVEQVFPRSERSPGETLLEVERLSGITKPVAASLCLRRGEVLGIAGLVGAGRSELLRSIFGLDAVRSGTIRVGAHVGPASPERRLRQGVGLLSEDRASEGLALPLSVAENLTLSRLLPAGSWRVSPRLCHAAAKRWIEKLNIRCRDPEQPCVELSGGNQQKVALARLLHHDVDVLLLDEPTRGIDVKSRSEIYELIDALAARGKAVLVVSSHLPELLGLCDRIHVMYRGVLSEGRSPASLDQHSLLQMATGA